MEFKIVPATIDDFYKEVTAGVGKTKVWNIDMPFWLDPVDDDDGYEKYILNKYWTKETIEDYIRRKQVFINKEN